MCNKDQILLYLHKGSLLSARYEINFLQQHTLWFQQSIACPHTLMTYTSSQAPTTKPTSPLTLYPTYIKSNLTTNILGEMELLYHPIYIRCHYYLCPWILSVQQTSRGEITHRNTDQRLFCCLQNNWYVFTPEDLCHHIHGYQCCINTGDAASSCYKKPYYGPHVSPIIDDLVNSLEKNDLIGDDDGSCGAMLVLIARANQENIALNEHIWYWCVSFQWINQIIMPTRPVAFTICQLTKLYPTEAPKLGFIYQQTMTLAFGKYSCN